MKAMVLSLLSLLWMKAVMGQQRIVYVSTPLNWTEAQAYCRQHYIDLVTVNNIAENIQLKKYTWLGLHRVTSSANWKWSKGDEPLTFTIVFPDWIYNPPNSGKDCVYKRPDGFWMSVDCNTTQKFYCLDHPLLLVREMKTWEKALVHCRSLSSGDRRYDLASLLTQEDRDSVRSQISDKVWTGLRFLGDRWVWVGGEEVQYDDIQSCPENERCGMMDKTISKDYNIANCEDKRHFFCYRKSTAD